MSSGKKIGRPTKKDDSTIKKLESIFQIDGTVGEACSYADISEVAYYDWIKNDEVFSKNMKAAQNYPFILARKALMNGIMANDIKAAIEYLKRRDRRYKDKSEEDVNANIIVDFNLEGKSIKELEELRQTILQSKGK